MKPPVNPVTPEDIKAFNAFVRKWQDLLNLNDWRIVHIEKTAKGAMANVGLSVVDRMAMYRIGAEFGTEPVNDWSLESTACHELLHILLAEFREAIEGKATEDLIRSLEHRIVHTLERLLVPKT